MSWQTHKTGVGAGRTSSFLSPFNQFAFLPPAASVRQAEELSLTATNIPTRGIHQPHVPRERTKGLSKSDPQGVQIARQDDRVPILRRTRTLEEVKIESIIQPPSSQRKLPPISSSIVGNPMLTMGSGCKLGLTDSQLSLEESEAGENSSTTDDEDEDLLDDTSGSSDPPPSGLGFRDESQSSFTSLAEFNFPPPTSSNDHFPATIVQEHELIDHEKYAAAVRPSGLSPRVNNIVRGFEIRGPLDRDLMCRAINCVAKLHPILSATFTRTGNKLRIQTSQEIDQVIMESPPVSHERPSELITIARRKLFQLTVTQHNDTRAQKREEPGTAHDDGLYTMSIVSFNNSPDMKPRVKSGAKMVKFQLSTAEVPTKKTTLPKLSESQEPAASSSSLLMRAKLVSRSTQEHILVLSFSRLVCDYWSSCLFVQQLADAYTKLEKSSKPSFASVRVDAKRQEVIGTFEQMQGKGRGRISKIPSQPKDAMSRLLQKRAQRLQCPSSKQFVPIFPPAVHFRQVAFREHQLLLIRPREKLWSFWQSMVTAIIHRRRGPPRIKVVPPVRIPSGLGEVNRTFGAARPTTARLRPLTARNRPQTGRTRQLGETQSQESLSGPKKSFHFFKVEEAVGAMFLQSVPEECLMKIEKRELLGLLCLGAYVLLLGKCCRGWGSNDKSTRLKMEGREGERQVYGEDPLKDYHQGMEDSPNTARNRLRMERRGGGLLDVGSFLLGVEVSMRQQAPALTQGLFGPLSNVVGLRVNLSSCELFTDLMLQLWRNLHGARCHAHYPFATIADELGLVQGLPVQFAYLYPEDVQQVSNPDAFYFIETAVGVEGRALARFGSYCYLNPLNTKLDDYCHMQLLMWEGVKGNSIDGGFIYQAQVLRLELMQLFSEELTRLITAIAKNPSASLLELTANTKSPFPHLGKSRRRRV